MVAIYLEVNHADCMKLHETKWELQNIDEDLHMKTYIYIIKNVVA